MNQTPIRFSPWIPWTSLTAEMKSHPLIGTTLAIFHKRTTLANFSSHLSPLTPLQDNPDFLPGVRNRSLRSKNTNKSLLAMDCFYNQDFRDFTDFSRPLTELEAVCKTGEPIPKVTSLAYSWIQNGASANGHGFRESWSTALGMSLLEVQWRKACIFAHKCSLSTSTQETAYKLLTQWYATPVKLHSWFPDYSDTCWRCHKERGTLLHIWWQCPVWKLTGQRSGRKYSKSQRHH